MRLTHRANTDPASPFKGLIDFGFSDSVGFLDENVMFQVISAFVDMPRRYSIIYSSVPEWTSDTHYDHRLSLFYRFWSAIRNKYPQAWEKGLRASDEEVKNGARQIFMKAAMLVLQKLLLEIMVRESPKRQSRNQLSPLGDPDLLYDDVTTSLYFLPEEFFTRAWVERQLDTSDRREFLGRQMQSAIQNQGKKLGNLQLFIDRGRKLVLSHSR